MGYIAKQQAPSLPHVHFASSAASVLLHCLDFDLADLSISSIRGDYSDHKVKQKMALPVAGGRLTAQECSAQGIDARGY